MGKLYVVPTPVGNLEDMTFRAIRVLKEADLILAEDTRTSGILLKHYEIKNAMQSHHKFNEHKTVEGVVNRIKACGSIGGGIALFALNFIIGGVIGGFVLAWRLIVAVWYVPLTIYRLIIE